MSRITPEEVVEAYRKTGLKAQQKRYFSVVFTGMNTHDCACGLGAMYAASVDYGSRLTADKAVHMADEKYGTNYRNGFTHGFDNVSAADWMSDNKEYNQGHDDGQAAWDKVNEEGLVWVETDNT